MNGRRLAGWFTVIAVVLLALPGMRAQTWTAAADSWTPSRTPWGDPDLQGVWSFATITPLERPREFSGRERLTDEEAAALNQRALTRGAEPPRPGSIRSYNEFWRERGESTGRTALVVDPPDGHLPPVTPDAQRRAAARAEASRGRGPADSWQDRNLTERCIHWQPLPRLPTTYNNVHQIFQNPGYVVILTEMIHDVRPIPLDGRPQIDDGIRLWNGDSRGRWEGDTLVVETTHFSGEASFQGSGEGNSGVHRQGSANRQLVERFTRVADDTIEWEFTVDDPTTWTRSWTGTLPFSLIEGPVYEFACHEGNYSLINILAGARATENAAKATNTESK